MNDADGGASARGQRLPHLVIVMALSSPWSVDIACALSATGFRVTVATTQRLLSGAASERSAEGTQRLAAARIPVHEICRGPSILPQAVRAALQLRSLCRDDSADHVLALYGGNHAVATWLSGIRPYSIYWVGSDVNMPGLLRATIQKAPFRNAYLNVANGRALADAARGRLGSTRLVEIYLGIDTDFWGTAGERRPGGVVCTRWFEPIYDNRTILRAFVEGGCADLGMSLTFTSSGSELAECRSIATETARAGAENQVTFLGGITRQALRKELQQAEIFVSMSHSDGTSTALLEAMASGCFPVLSDIAANREWIAHGCDIELVRPGDATGLADAMRRVYKDVGRRTEALPRNRRIVEMLASNKTNMARLSRMLMAGTNNGGDKLAECGSWSEAGVIS